MPAGKRSSRVLILHYADAQDDIGQPVKAWTTFKTVYGDVRNLSGLETIKGGAETAIAQASIRILYRTDLTTAMRAQVGATVYEITAVLPDEGKREHTDLTCKVIV